MNINLKRRHQKRLYTLELAHAMLWLSPESDLRVAIGGPGSIGRRDISINVGCVMLAAILVVFDCLERPRLVLRVEQNSFMAHLTPH